MTDLRGFIAGMPKCELHVHHRGHARAGNEVRAGRTQRHDAALQDVAEMRAAYDFHDLPSFLKIYYRAWGCWCTSRIFTT